MKSGTSGGKKRENVYSLAIHCSHSAFPLAGYWARCRGFFFRGFVLVGTLHREEHGWTWAVSGRQMSELTHSEGFVSDDYSGRSAGGCEGPLLHLLHEEAADSSVSNLHCYTPEQQRSHISLLSKELPSTRQHYKEQSWASSTWTSPAEVKVPCCS